MGNSGDGKFRRWGFYELGSSRDGELRRWEVHEMGIVAHRKFSS